MGELNQEKMALSLSLESCQIKLLKFQLQVYVTVDILVMGPSLSLVPKVIEISLIPLG